eukprot:3490880-Rhodomonas_salina.1
MQKKTIPVTAMQMLLCMSVLITGCFSQHATTRFPASATTSAASAAPAELISTRQTRSCDVSMLASTI